MAGDNLSIRVALDAAAGGRNLEQRVLRFGRGRSKPRETLCEDVWYVVGGRGHPWLDGRGVTQFVGWIPPGRAPAHTHTYEEAVYVLEGEGVPHLDQRSRPVAGGSCAHLPPPVPHCLEDTGGMPLRVLGVIHPAGSPAAKTQARGGRGLGSR